MTIEILFINSPTEKYPESGRNYSYDCIPSYGLLYCATICINLLGNSRVSVVDAEYNGLSPAQISEVINRTSPRYIAINATSVNYDVVIEIISLVKTNRSVIVGGTHAIISPEDFFIEQIIDKILFVCKGAGEPVLQDFFSGIPIENISNIAYFNGTNIISNKIDCRIFPFDDIIVYRKLVPHDPHIKSREVIESYMLTSRGCPYSCAFCAANIICQRKIFFRSANSISAEFSYLKRLGVNYIRFIDDLLMINSKRLELICQCIAENGWNSSNFGFEATGRIDTLHKMNNDIWDTLMACGCQELEIGVESGSSKILKLMNKHYSQSSLLDIVNKAVMHRIKLKIYLIVGYLSETTDDLKQTFDLCIKLKNIGGEYVRFSATPAKAYPGTSLYQKVKDLSINKNSTKNWFVNCQNINLTKVLNITDPGISQLLRKRTRYNAMHIFNKKAISLSEISGGAKTIDIYKLLCDIALLSDNKSPLFYL